MVEATSQVSKQQAIRTFYEKSDSGAFAAELFAPDFQFFVPKYGIGHGAQQFFEMAGATGVKQVMHQIADLVFIESGNMVAVEGTTEGVGTDGVRWKAGQTPGGRFCSIFEFENGGLIARMHVYLDPDMTGADTERFRWQRGAAQKW
jgi:ketosteroid isomerase-like protein